MIGEREQIIFSDLKKIMATLLKTDLNKIDQMASLDSKLREDLGIDSVESLDFLTEIENVYSIHVLDQEAMKLERVSDVIKLILSKK